MVARGRHEAPDIADRPGRRLGQAVATHDGLVFAAGAVKQWPWPTVAAVTRMERDVAIDQRGRPTAARLRMNTFGDALIVVALAERLRANRP